MLQLRDLTRRFGELTAVDSASFDVPAGARFGYMPEERGLYLKQPVLAAPHGGPALVAEGVDHRRLVPRQATLALLTIGGGGSRSCRCAWHHGHARSRMSELAVRGPCGHAELCMSQERCHNGQGSATFYLYRGICAYMQKPRYR